ncbi:MAG: LysE family translocator, partial [Acetobacteraceae bacterium]
LGAGEVFRTWPGIERGMRFAGAAYLLWLAWRIGTAQPKFAVAGGAGRPLGFFQAALFQWVNPKAWVIAVGAVVTFTSGGGAVPARSVLARSLALAALFLLASLSSVAFWAGVGTGAGRLLRRPAALRAFNVAMALLLVAALVPLFAEGG